MAVILILLSMLGMPPMAGFCGKFLMAIFMNLQSNFFFFFFFIILNLFMIYFYLQNFRYLIKKTSSTDLTLNTNFFKIIEKNYLILVLILFFLFFFIFFFNDLLIIFSSFLFF
jgi:NADH:ubiquinone oxidoreductase subunit 2 (subunit N)